MNRLDLYKRLKDIAYATILREIPAISYTEASIYASQITKITMDSTKLPMDGEIPEPLAEQVGAILQSEIQLLIAGLRETILRLPSPPENWDGVAG